MLFAFPLPCPSPRFCRAKACTRARPFVSPCIARQLHQGTAIIVSWQMEGLCVPNHHQPPPSRRIEPRATRAERPSHRLASPPNNKYPMIDFNWALAILPPPSPFSPRSPNFSHLSYHAKRENFLSSYARYPLAFYLYPPLYPRNVFSNRSNDTSRSLVTLSSQFYRSLRRQKNSCSQNFPPFPSLFFCLFVLWQVDDGNN